jgi:uncharacterized protein (TIGR02147 family)
MVTSTATIDDFQSTDPRLFLSAELTRRIQKNPRYSMRRFAQALGLSHTVLSLVLSGKRPLSKKAANQVSDFFGLDAEKREALIANRKSESPKKVTRADQYQQISLDTFSVISDWYHFAILSLLDIGGSKIEARWISVRLGISEIEAKLAIERLLRLGLLERVTEGSRKGEWKAGKPLDVKNTSSTLATRKFHRQLLERAVESMEHDAYELRELSSMTMAIDPAQVPYAREKIRIFRDELTAQLEKRGQPKQVYNLNIQLFPLSKTEAERKNR